MLTTLVAQPVFPYQAQGSLIESDGEVVGSELIGQQFTDPQYFHPRPSATLAANLEDSEPVQRRPEPGAAIYGPTNKALISTVQERATTYREENGLPSGASVPVDAVTASGSGLDPHISVANADLQVARVAEERGIPRARYGALIEENTQGRLLGLLGEPGVNVLELNLALDALEQR